MVINKYSYVLLRKNDTISYQTILVLVFYNNYNNSIIGVDLMSCYSNGIKILSRHIHRLKNNIFLNSQFTTHTVPRSYKLKKKIYE